MPSGFCDNDIQKQGKYLNSLPKIKIFSIDDAEKDRFSKFFVVSPFHIAEILGQMIYEKQITPERILNFHPIIKKKTCPIFRHSAVIHDQGFMGCCIGGNRPNFGKILSSPKEDVKHFSQMRDRIFSNETENFPQICKSCHHYKPSYVFQSPKLNSFNFSFRGWCNYKCVYCSAGRPEAKQYNNNFFLEEYLIELEQLGMLNEVFSVLFATGEPCLNEKRFGLYSFCEAKEYFLEVFSNCSVFDEHLFDLSQRSPVIIRASIDAGTRETYNIIKGLDSFEKVIKNVDCYLKNPYIVFNPKYLFVPGVNDNEKDIEEFVKICRDWNIDFVTPVFSFLDEKYHNSNRAKEMFSFLVHELSDNNILTVSASTLYAENYYKVYEKSFYR